MTAQTMFFRYELACKGFSMEKTHHLVTYQNDFCCFINRNCYCVKMVLIITKQKLCTLYSEGLAIL